uniref:NADH dehydrogenase [ubiquinone] iron-sulfur protein 6, mitochondrial n=1 Tax=Chrysemys picta bellii TaxID=8478 RepID=A0A8C3FB52_CHRPI
MKGSPVSSQRLSSWITSCIRTCYDLAGVSAPHLTAHSTRAQASSTAFLAQVPIQDICRAAVWSSVHTFTAHYALVQQSRDDAAFGSVVLHTVNETFAIDLIAEQPVNKVESRVISCDGGGGALGHPKVYINLDKDTKTGTCGYCGLQFKQKHHH